VSGDYEFSKKPHRMTSPPANKCKWLPGYSGVNCRLETDPTRIAILCREATWGSVFDFELTDEIIESTIQELEGGKVLGAAFEVPALAFVMRGSRSTMDQLLRLRESAGASHTTRDNDFRDFNIIVPNTIESLGQFHSHNESTWQLHQRCVDHIDSARQLYGDLVDAGIPPQDARYIALPMGYQGDWVQVMNLRALVKECEQRLCNGLTQHESNYLVRLQRDVVVAKWPWMDRLLRSSCEKRGQCVSRSMLFPPCGAFGQFRDREADGMRVHRHDEEPMIIARDQYDPEVHLYPPEQNDAMRFAEWDRERVELERCSDSDGLTIHYRFGGPPEPIDPLGADR
jgi:hypothetical protein